MSILLWILTGISVFSFVNVLIYRIPRKLGFVNGRSICPFCSHTLSAADLIPVFGYLCLGGNCRYCGHAISPRYMAVELLGGGAGGLCYLIWGNSWMSALELTFFALMTAVSLIDADTLEIPDGLVLSLLALGLLKLALSGGEWLYFLIGTFSVSLPMLLIAFVVKDAFGGGDIKLMAAGGMFLGIRFCLLSWLLATLLGGIYGIWLIVVLKRSKKQRFAFGPFLCIGMAVSNCWGELLLSWYFGLFQ